MLKPNNYTFLLLVFLISKLCFSQTKDDLKEQKNNIEQKITYTKKLLQKTNTDKTKSQYYLKVLKTQITKQQELVKTLATEIQLLQKQIKRNQAQITAIKREILEEEKKILQLKNEYAKMIYNFFVKKAGANDLIYIISSTSFNQAYKRIAYLKQYSEFRKNQVKKIGVSTKNLELKKIHLLTKQDELIVYSKDKNSKITHKQEEIYISNKIKSEKTLLVNELKKDEKKLREQIKYNEIKKLELDQKIRKIIEEEIRKSRLDSKSNKFTLTPEAQNLSSEFVSNKGKLPWPLSSGVIIQNYGNQNHPVLPGIKIFNNGIDIATEENSEVRAIFDGFISRIFFIKGEGKAVLINHGEYFSVYSGLKEVFVQTNEKILAKEKIGVIQTHRSEKKTELHFEIWKNYDKENPCDWLYNAD